MNTTHNKVLNVIVTGASSGIGAATAELLASKGHQVFALARRHDRLKALCDKYPNNIQSAVVDLSQASSIESFCTQHQPWLEGCDVLINNAGLALGRERFQDVNQDDLHTMLQTNINGLMLLTRQVLPLMIKKSRGHIINLGSIAGQTAYPGGAVYCATKAAIHMFSDALREDLVGTGLRVSTIAPGRVETEFSEVRFKGDRERAKAVYQGYRPLTAQDIAQSIAWVAEQPEHINVQHMLIMSTDQPNATVVSPVV